MYLRLSYLLLALLATLYFVNGHIENTSDNIFRPKGFNVITSDHRVAELEALNELYKMGKIKVEGVPNPYERGRKRRASAVINMLDRLRQSEDYEVDKPPESIFLLRLRSPLIRR